MASAKQTRQNIVADSELNSMGWPFFLIVDNKGIIQDVKVGFATGDDIHEELPAKAPYKNKSVQWMMHALETAQVSQK